MQLRSVRELRLARRAEAPRSDQVTIGYLWPNRSRTDPNFIGVSGDAPVGDSHLAVARAGENGAWASQSSHKRSREPEIGEGGPLRHGEPGSDSVEQFLRRTLEARRHGALVQFRDGRTHDADRALTGWQRRVAPRYPSAQLQRHETFSAIPTKATGAVIPGRTPSPITPPSSRTISSATPRLSSNAAIARAPLVPPTSSSCP
jgi:hypothetical protein